MNARGAIYAGTAAILYGSAYVATAIALRSFTPLTIGAWRGLAGAALVMVLVLAAGMRTTLPRRLDRATAWRLGVLGLVGGAIFVVAINAAVALIGASVTAFVAGLYAVTAAILAVPVLGERLERSTLVALLAALVGTALLAEVQPGEETVLGIGLALLAALCFGLFLVLSRRWGTAHGLTGPLVGLATLTISGVLCLLLALAAGQPMVPDAARLDAVIATGWIAVAPGAAGQVLVVAGMRRLEARYASAMLLLNPPTAAILSVLLLGQGLTPVQLVGAAAVLVAIAFASGIVGHRRHPYSRGRVV
ncbi:MAG TPA: DMT family transporter [Candidatus Limnocylindria bacterium]|nr:DMT family transporter [Candidatus Limnocylindria bacterium]